MLVFTTTATNLIITGKTYPIKEQIKALGGIWKSRQWLLPINSDTPMNRESLLESCRIALKVEKDAAKALRTFSPESRAETQQKNREMILECLHKKNAGDFTYHWICCENCVVVDWSRQHTTCETCGKFNGMWKETFFVRGRLRTGD
jgi:hypothetical protein